MKRNILCKIILLLVFSAQSLANWSAKEREHMKNYKPYFSHPYLGTLKSLCEKGKYKKSKFKGVYSKYTVNLPEYFEEDLEFNLVLQQVNGQFIKAPLMVAVPGAFTNLDDDQSIMWMQYFSQLGYHVITFPNPWGTDYIGKKTKFKMGDFRKEGESLYQAFNAIYKHLQKKDLVTNKVHLFGMSYGAFMASMINSYAAKSGFYFTKTTLLAPPFDLAETVKVLDEQIKEIKDLDVSGGLLGTMFNFKKVCKLEKEEDATASLLDWSKFIAVREGFQKEIVNSMIEFDDVHELDLVPGKFSGDLKDWKNIMDFGKYFEVFSPELKPIISSPQSTLHYWMRLSETYGAKNLRVMASDDDFINVKFRKAKDDNLVLLRGGGHFGFRNSKWFDQFISLAF